MQLFWKYTMPEPTENSSTVNLDIHLSGKISKHRKYSITSFGDVTVMQNHCPTVPPCSSRCDNAASEQGALVIYFSRVSS